jgi:PAS domain S-box-containing protein
MKENEDSVPGSPRTTGTRPEARGGFRGLATSLDGMPLADVQALVHELQARHIELEIQNDELLRAQEAAEVSKKYRDMFDFAPIGYFRLSEEGQIMELNLTGAALLGLDRTAAVGQRLGNFVAVGHRDVFDEFCGRVSARREAQTCEIELHCDGGQAYAIVEGIPALDDKANHSLRLIITDISGRKQAEEALRRSEAEFRAMFDVASIGMAQADPLKGRWLRVNQKMCSITGYSADEMLTMRLSELTYPEDRDRDWEMFQQVVRGDRPDYRLEKRYVRKDGSQAWVNVNMTIIRDATGQPLRTMATIEDITERKRTEEALRESLERFRGIVENSAAGYFFIDREGCFRSVNNAWLRMHKYDSPEEILGRHFADTQLDADRSRAQEIIDRLLAGEPLAQGEFMRRCKDGSTGWHILSANPVKQGGTATGVEGFLFDITRRMQAERNYSTLFREMLNGFALHEIICDPCGNPVDYRFLAVNPAFERLTGLKAEDLLGKTVLEVLPDTEKDWIEIYGKVAFTGEPANFESHSAGIDKHFEVTAFRPAPGQFACIFGDITDRKNAEREKARLQAQFQQAQKMESVGRLAGGVAHDFNNMLQAILSNVEMALGEIPANSPAHESLEAIRSCAERSADLTRQLLAFARRQAIAPKVLDLNDTVEGLLKMMRRLIGEDINLTWVPAVGLWPVRVDPTQIDQILANLCVNARDAIGGVGKIIIETGNAAIDDAYCSGHPGSAKGEYVLLTVSDDGCGMDKEVLGRIFEPFFTTKGIGVGTGLGLATTYGIVKQNDGFVQVHSEPGRGTTFQIYLPRHASPTVTAQKEMAPDFAKSSGETILLVEDEPVILSITRKFLTRLGYKVLVAGTPDEAIRQAEFHADKIHLLVTDVVMPEMNGRDLSVRLSSLRPGLKCLFMSGYTSDVISHHGVLEESVTFIQKPFSPEELAAKIRAVLGAGEEKIRAK